jgi:hypothetical protein
MPYITTLPARRFSHCLLVIILTFACQAGFATVVINDAFKSAPLLEVSAFEDPTHKIDSLAIINGAYDTLFVPSKEVLNFRYSTSSWWVKFNVKNSGATAHRIVLDIASSNINHLHLYLTGSDTIIASGATGLDFPFDEEKIMFGDYFFPFTLEPGKEYTGYLKVKNNIASLRLPLKLWDRKAFYHNHQLESIGWGIFIGILLLIALFNIMVFVVLKDRVYLYYFIYVLALLI